MNCISIESLREHKIGGFVVFDYLIALLSVYAGSQFLNISLFFAFIILVVIVIATCYYCDINTYMNNYLGLCSAPTLDSTSQTSTDTTTVPTTNGIQASVVPTNGSTTTVTAPVVPATQ
jgi:hypothetical protein